MEINFLNSLSRKNEYLNKPNEKIIGVYACGPTVYDFVTIGNWRTYTLSDLTVRVLKYKGYEVDFVMNITDVGHLTGDNTGDADTGEDRMEKAKIREGKKAKDIAEFYTNDFFAGYEKLNLTKPKIFARATDHIPEQIDLIKKLEDKNLAYKISDGIYFDTNEFEKLGFVYGELSDLDKIKKGARVEFNNEKRDARDFALWKFSPLNEKRDMEWDSPWGIGFPGWHIECSAMAMKYLGNQFDIHIGGEDLKSTHHPNEIAQSEGATGQKPFVKIWLHGAFLKVDGGRMGKSLGNAYTLKDIEDKSYKPLSLRYFYLGTHYQTSMNFTWEGLLGAQNALLKAYRLFNELGDDIGEVSLYYKEKFENAVFDNLMMPEALKIMWEVFKDDNLPNEIKKATLLDFDKVLGLNFENQKVEEIPDSVKEIISKRNKAREEKDWDKSDALRKEIEDLGYEVFDTQKETKVLKK